MPTTFAQLEELVIDQTRRPEIPDVTKSAIKFAVLRAHHLDFFPRDLAEQQILYTPSNSLMYPFPNLSTIVTRLRAIKGLRGVDPATTREVEDFEYRELDDLYDEDGAPRRSVYCVIGDTLRLYPVLASGAFYLYYFQNPQTAETGFSSWIADLYPEQLAVWAAQIVQSRTGNEKISRALAEEQVRPFSEMLVASHLLMNVN